MAGKTTLAAAVAATVVVALLPTSPPVMAEDGRVEILRGQPPAKAISVSADEGVRGVTVYRGSSNFVAAKAAAAEPVAYIGGERIRIDRLESVGNWFLDRSGDDLTLVHCYTRQSTMVGGARRILCTARRF
jgi:hypothetical protein